MRGAKQVSPIEFRLGISTYWEVSSVPKFLLLSFRTEMILKQILSAVFYRWISVRNKLKYKKKPDLKYGWLRLSKYRKLVFPIKRPLLARWIRAACNKDKTAMRYHLKDRKIQNLVQSMVVLLKSYSEVLNNSIKLYNLAITNRFSKITGYHSALFKVIKEFNWGEHIIRKRVDYLYFRMYAVWNRQLIAKKFFNRTQRRIPTTGNLRVSNQLPFYIPSQYYYLKNKLVLHLQYLKINIVQKRFEFWLNKIFCPLSQVVYHRDCLFNSLLQYGSISSTKSKVSDKKVIYESLCNEIISTVYYFSTFRRIYKTFWASHIYSIKLTRFWRSYFRNYISIPIHFFITTLNFNRKSKTRKYNYSFRYFLSENFFLYSNEWVENKLKFFKQKFLVILLVNYAFVFRNLMYFMIIFRRLIEKTRKHRRIIASVLYIIACIFQLKANLRGYRLHIVGTIEAHGRTKTETYVEGAIPLSSLKWPIEYSSIQCITPYGCIGIKIWVSYFSFIKDEEIDINGNPVVKEDDEQNENLITTNKALTKKLGNQLKLTQWVDRHFTELSVKVAAIREKPDGDKSYFLWGCSLLKVNLFQFRYLNKKLGIIRPSNEELFNKKKLISVADALATDTSTVDTSTVDSLKALVIYKQIFTS